MTLWDFLDRHWGFWFVVAMLFLLPMLIGVIAAALNGTAEIVLALRGGKKGGGE